MVIIKIFFTISLRKGRCAVGEIWAHDSSVFSFTPEKCQVECSPRLSYDGTCLTYLDNSYIILSHLCSCICPRQIQILSFSYLIFRTLGEVSYLRYINLKIFFYHNWLWSKQPQLNLILSRRMRRKERNAFLWNSKGPLNVKNATRGLRKRNTWENTSLRYTLIKISGSVFLIGYCY